MKDVDLVVIGGGAAGLGAAREARRRGARVRLITASEPGGDCTFTGCVPSKTLIAAARAGLTFPAATARIHAAIDRVAAAESADVLRAEGIEVIRGHARLHGNARGSVHLDVDGMLLQASRVVLATGSRPALPPIPGLGDVPYLTNESVFELRSAPHSLLVIGGGAIGCELAQAFARFGTRVTLVETGPRLLPAEDARAAAILTDVFTEAGITVRAATGVQNLVPGAAGASAVLSDGTRVEAERVLVATGRRAETADLGLDAAGIRVDVRGVPVTDPTLRAAAGIFAAGDVTARAMLTHAADDMGRHAAANALRRRPRPWRPPVIPRVVFTSPEIAQVGLGRDDAPTGARIAHLPLDEVDRAITDDATAGFIELIAGPRPVLRNLGGGRLLGATIVAPRAGEMLAEAALAIATGMFTGRLAATMHAYPTWSSAVQVAAAQFFVEIGGRRAHDTTGGPGPAR